MIAFIIGLCYSGALSADQAGIITTQGAIVAMVCENVFSPMYGVLASFPQDLALFTREYNSGLYSSGIFYVSKMIAFVSIVDSDFLRVGLACVRVNKKIDAPGWA